MRNKIKVFFVLLFSLAILYTIYSIYDTYALLETNVSVVNDFNTAKWNININNTTLSGEPTTFLVDKIEVVETDYNKENKLAPGTTGYFDIEIDPTDTDVSIRYDISFDFSSLSDSIDVLSIQETMGGNLVKTAASTYTNVLTLTEIKEGKKNNIRVNIIWNNIEANNEQDSQLGLVYDNKIDIPVTITVTQYLGEEIIEFEG